MTADPRVRVVQPTRGIARYMVFMPEAGANEIGFVTHQPSGLWDFQRRDESLSLIAYRRRRDAVDALVAEWDTRND